MVLWGKEGFVGSNYSVIKEWEKVAEHVEGKAVDGGHYIPEESPKETIDIIMNYLK